MNLLATLGNILRHTARFVVRHYYSAIEVTGRGRIPASGPVVFVANHPNSMLDPALVGLTVARPVHFVSKAPLFDVPVMGALMRALGMIPAFRGRDDIAQVGRNAGSLDAAAKWLVRGDTVGIFPEGISHDLLRVEQVRGGAARMAVSAARAGARVIVVPLGLNYECKERFRSAVWVRVGEPLDVVDALPAWGEDDRKAVRLLTNEIDRRLKAVVVHLDEECWAPFLPDLEVLLPPPPEFVQVPGAPLRQRKRIADAMNHFLATDRPRAEAMAAAIERHRVALAAERLELRSDVMRFHGRRMFFRMLRQTAWLAVTLVPALAGTMHHVIPFEIIRLLANRLRQPGRDTLALYQLLIALPVYALWYVLVWWQLAGWTQPWIATLWTVLMPLAGVRALLFVRAVRTTIPVLWHECRLLLRPRRLHELRRQQLDVRHQLRLIAGDYAKIHARGETFG
ncbi:MAG: hypothetical protein EXS31_16335 [Pedosphaera sp.]|nr:hypothetical protein [Pedosphaera sp.]